MYYEKVNAISTAVISFVTVIGLIIGFYYNLISRDTKLVNIIILEIFMLTMIGLFLIWILTRGRKYDA